MIAMQLDLWQSQLESLPWMGRSPRELTRGSIALFLRREPQKDERFFVDPAQLDLFRAVKRKAPWKYQGAPFLLPF